MLNGQWIGMLLLKRTTLVLVAPAVVNMMPHPPPYILDTLLHPQQTINHGQCHR
jgi:hypothetical protein